MTSLSELNHYRDTAMDRQATRRNEVEQRRKVAWTAARDAAVVLRERFRATRVVVFGSLARGAGFTRWSDVDIAAWGLGIVDTFRAIGAVMDVSDTIRLNLTDVNTARASLLQEIEREGIDL